MVIVKSFLVYLTGIMVRVFCNGSGNLGSISGRVIPKTQKIVLDPSLTLSIIRYRSRVKWSNPKKGVMPFLHLGVVAIEKRAFGLPLTTVGQLT